MKDEHNWTYYTDGTRRCENCNKVETSWKLKCKPVQLIGGAGCTAVIVVLTLIIIGLGIALAQRCVSVEHLHKSLDAAEDNAQYYQQKYYNTMPNWWIMID